MRIPKLKALSFYFLINTLFLILNFVCCRHKHIFLKEALWLVLFNFTLFSFFISFPRIQKAFFILFWVPSSLLAFFKIHFNIVFDTGIALSMIDAKNQSHLVTEFLEIKLILWIIFIVILPCIFIALVKVIPKKPKTFLVNSLTPLSLAFFTVLLILLKVDKLNKDEDQAIGIGHISRNFHYFSPFDIINSFRSAIRINIKHNKIFKSNFIFLSKNFRFELNKKYEKELENLKIIFVLGETTRGDRLQLNGYKRNTTPNLMKLKENFYNFKGTTSCNTYTQASLKCLFTRMTFQDYQDTIMESAFTDVLSSVGFKISTLSLQGMGDYYKYLGSEKIILKYDIKSSKNILFDKDLLPILKEELSVSKGKDFILLHTLGSHYHYGQRVPEEFEFFKPTCKNTFKSCTTEEVNNAYDNTIYYFDSFIADVIKMVENENAIIFYISDHGESLGEEGNFFHSHDKKIAPKEQLDVPFFIYLSPKFASTKIGKLSKKGLEKNVKRLDTSHDNIFNSVLGCIGIQNNDTKKPLIDQKLNLCK